MPPVFPTKRILGIDFFDGTAAEAVEEMASGGGLLVAPAAPSMIALQTDPDYRRAMTEADLAIADSGWLVLFWRLLRRERVARISGLALFHALLEAPAARTPGKLFWILPSERAEKKALEFSRAHDYATTAADCYVAPKYGPNPADTELLTRIKSRRPPHIIIAIGGGMQDKLGAYLKNNLDYQPAIYCIGAAPGFVTGDQVGIPMWADRLRIGWIFRVVSAPRMYFNRYAKAIWIPALIIRFGREMPPLRREADRRGQEEG